MATDKSGNDARRAYLRRFREGWETFHADPDAEITSDGDPSNYPPPPRKGDNLSPRQAYVRKFADRWREHHAAEEEDDRAAFAVVWVGLVKVLPLLLFAGFSWLAFDASRATQWIVFGIGMLLLIGVAYDTFRESK